MPPFPVPEPTMHPNSQRPVWKTFLMFLGPMMLANILQSLSGTLNTMYLGKMIGVGALAAASAFFPVMLFIISFVMGLGSGASVLIGQAWGAKQPERVQAVAGTTLSVGLIAGLVIAVFGGIFTRSLLQGLSTPPDILDDATAYARIVLISMPGFFVFLLITSVMRGVGDMITPLKAMLVSTSVGMLVTPALIRGWWGLPQMGVRSAACAMAVSFIVALIWLGVHLHRKGSPLAPSRGLLEHMKIEKKILLAVLRIGVPTALQMVIMSLAEVALLSLVNGFGSDATAAYGTSNQVLGYVQFPAMSIAIAASILGAQTIGAGHPEKLGAITRAGIYINFAVTGSLLLLCYLFSRQVVGLFTTNPEVIETTQRMLHIVLWSILVFGCSAVVSGVMRASGAVMVPVILSISAILLVEVPVAFVASRHIGLDGVWIAYPACFIAMLIFQTTYYRLFWRKQAIRKLI